MLARSRCEREAASAEGGFSEALGQLGQDEPASGMALEPLVLGPQSFGSAWHVCRVQEVYVSVE